MWLPLAVASLVIIFGLYRIRLFFRNSEEEKRAREKKGMFGFPGRTHLLIGVIYLILGGALVATTFGWNPLAGAFGTEAPDSSSETPVVPGGGKAIRIDSTK
jgi:hypothetical protein